MKVLSFKYLYGRTKLIINFASKRSRNKLLKNVLFFLSDYTENIQNSDRIVKSREMNINFAIFS